MYILAVLRAGSFLQPFMRPIYMFLPEAWDETHRHKIWILGWDQMVYVPVGQRLSLLQDFVLCTSNLFPLDSFCQHDQHDSGEIGIPSSFIKFQTGDNLTVPHLPHKIDMKTRCHTDFQVMTLNVRELKVAGFCVAHKGKRGQMIRWSLGGRVKTLVTDKLSLTTNQIARGWSNCTAPPPPGEEEGSFLFGKWRFMVDKGSPNLVTGRRLCWKYRCHVRAKGKSLEGFPLLMLVGELFAPWSVWKKERLVICI